MIRNHPQGKSRDQRYYNRQYSKWTPREYRELLRIGRNSHGSIKNRSSMDLRILPEVQRNQQNANELDIVQLYKKARNQNSSI